jgi:hypothetical protein
LWPVAGGTHHLRVFCARSGIGTWTHRPASTSLILPQQFRTTR